MGTTNFALENASNYFVINNEDGFFHEIAFNDLLDDILELNNKSIEYGRYDCDSYKLKLTENRNYPRRYIASADIDCNYAGIELQVTLIAFMCSGYYENGNLDWLLLFNQDEYNTIDDGLNEAIDDSIFNMYINPGMAKIHKAKFLKRSESLIEKHVKDLEEVYKKHSVNQLRLVGRFSNGEAVFEQVQS